MDDNKAILNELAILKAEFVESKKVIATISGQISYLTQLSETIVEYGNPCKESQVNSADSLAMVKEMLANSPLKKHPMFKDLLKPLEDMIEKQRA